MASNKGKRRNLPANFFVAVHPVVMMLTLALIYCLMMAWLWPDGVPSKMFGQLTEVVSFIGHNYQHYIKIILLLMLALHVIEGAVALWLCMRHKLNLKVTTLWVLQTLVFGIFSLRYLLWPHFAVLHRHLD